MSYKCISDTCTAGVFKKKISTCYAQRCSIGGMFSVVPVCMYVCCLSIYQRFMNRLRYHHEVFTGARYGQELGRVQKRLYSDAVRRADGYLMSDVLVESAMWTAHGSKMTSCRCSRWLADLCSFEF